MAKPSACVPVDSLVDLACRDGVDVRPTLARVLTDLYVQRPSHSGEEETQYVELVLGLIDSVDAKTRAAVAEKLRQYPKAPAAVLRRLDSLAATNPADDENSEDLLELFFSSAPEERRLILTLIPTTALSLALAYADFRFVNLNRDLVEQAVVPLQQQGFRVWSAAESGLRFYLEQKGIVTLSNQDVTPGAGDLVSTSFMTRHNVSAVLPSPISSARTQPRPRRPRKDSHATPRS